LEPLGSTSYPEALLADNGAELDQVPVISSTGSHPPCGLTPFFDSAEESSYDFVDERDIELLNHVEDAMSGLEPGEDFGKALKHRLGVGEGLTSL
jgi:hypothetical protein